MGTELGLGRPGGRTSPLSSKNTVYCQVNGSRLEKTERHQSENYDFGTQRRILEAQKHHALNIVKKDLREVASRLKAEQTQPTTARTPSF